MKLLEKDFTKKGVKYTQLEKNERYVLYKCSSEGCTYYEIFKYKVNPYPKMFDNPKRYEYMEVYPSTEEFGKWGWCCSSLDRVRKMIIKHNL